MLIKMVFARKGANLLHRLAMTERVFYAASLNHCGKGSLIASACSCSVR